MKKILTLALVILCAWSAVMAVPAKRDFRTYTQSDGTTISVQMVGDEFFHCFLTKDGLPLGRADNGDFYYRTADGMSNQMAHEVGNRSFVEEQFISNQGDNLSVVAVESERSKMRRASARRKVGNTQVPTNGSPRVPIILVEYKDKKMSNTMETFQAQYTSGDKSAYQYFADQSNNKYTPQFDVYGIYPLDNNRSYYGGNDSNGDDKHVAKMVSDAIAKAGDDIDWSNYDNDGDGEADVCIVVYAGVGEAQSSVSNSIWPCQWELSSGAQYGDGSGAVTRNGVKIDRFAVFNEVGGSNDNGSQIDGVGTFCHEFSHCLGLPDFYETTYRYGYYGIGNWSLMDAGCYNNDGYTPIGYSAYEKNFMGWIDYITPAENTQYTLTPMNLKNIDTDKAIKITSHLNSNEYFILENRIKTGWDAYISDTGLMITHVTYVADRWSANTVNNQSVQLFTIVPADNKLSTYNENKDLYGETNHEFTSTSTPASKLNMKANGSLASSTGGAGILDQPVTEINIEANGNVSLWYMKGNVVIPTLDVPVLNDASNVSKTSFKASWTHEAEQDVTYTLELTKKSNANAIIEEDFTGLTTSTRDISETLDTYFANTGWTGSKLYADGGHLKFGTTSAAGSLITPVLDLSDTNGTVTVKFNAAAYGTDTNCKLLVSTDSDSKTVDLTTEATDYYVTLSCPAEGGQQISVSSVGTSKKRVVMYNVAVLADDASAAKVSETGDNNKRTITGITDKEYTITDLEEGATYNYKVKAVPVNAEEAVESAWSSVKSVKLEGDVVIVPEIIADPDSLVLNTIVGQEVSDVISVLAANLEGDVTVTLNDANEVFSLGTTTISKADAEEGSEFEVVFQPSAVGTFRATVVLTSTNAEEVVVPIIGEATSSPIEHGVPVLLEPADIDSTSFRAVWTSVEDAASYSLIVSYVNQASEPVSLLKETFSTDNFDAEGTVNIGSKLDDYMDNAGWTGDYVYEYTGGLRFGSAKYQGYITSPALDLTNASGKVSVKIEASLYNNDTDVPIAMSIGEQTDTVTLQENGVIILVFEADKAADQHVTISSGAIGKRFIVSSLEIFDGDITTTTAAIKRVEEGGDEYSRLITGIEDTTYMVRDLAKFGTFDYMVVPVFADGSEGESSNIMSVTLAKAAVIGDIDGDGEVNVTDVTALINIILSVSENNGNADITGDGKVNVSDVTALINIILGVN